VRRQIGVGPAVADPPAARPPPAQPAQRFPVLIRGGDMRFPKIEGLIRRRILVNFRVDPKYARAIVPAPLRPQLIAGAAQAGICLIRLESLRPAGLPAALGFASENAAHRIAVEWDAARVVQSGVFIPRRDTSSLLGRLAGGRLFPGAHHPAHFAVEDNGRDIAVTIASHEARTDVALRARAVATLPSTSSFASLAAASAFLQRGSVGYSRAGAGHLDGVRLVVRRWSLQPLEVEWVRSGYFHDLTRFPPGSVELDSAFVMRDAESCWLPEPRLALAPADARR